MLRCKGCSHHHQNTHDHQYDPQYDHYDDQEGKSVDRIVLNETAYGGISGSKRSPDEDELEVGAIVIDDGKGHPDEEGSDDHDVIVAGENRLQVAEVRRREGESDRRTSGFYL